MLRKAYRFPRVFLQLAPARLRSRQVIMAPRGYAAASRPRNSYTGSEASTKGDTVSGISAPMRQTLSDHWRPRSATASKSKTETAKVFWSPIYAGISKDVNRLAWG